VADFLLIANQTDDSNGRLLQAFEVASRRLEAKLWGLYENTPHRKSLVPGDKAIIYLAGNGRLGKHFIATTSIHAITEDRKIFSKALSSLSTPPIAAIQFGDIHFFMKPVSIKAIKDKLEFISQNTTKWGCVLQRGVKSISTKDALTIVGHSE